MGYPLPLAQYPEWKRDGFRCPIFSTYVIKHQQPPWSSPSHLWLTVFSFSSTLSSLAFSLLLSLFASMWPPDHQEAKSLPVANFLGWSLHDRSTRKEEVQKSCRLQGGACAWWAKPSPNPSLARALPELFLTSLCTTMWFIMKHSQGAYNFSAKSPKKSVIKHFC